MKRLIATVLAAISISAFAAWERVGSLQISDAKSQRDAAAKIGQMVGNPFAAAAIGASLADVPTVKFFGPAREGASTLLSLFVDKNAAAIKPEDALESLEYAVLYPVSLSKADFLKRHEGAVETNGVIIVKGNFSGENTDDEKTYVMFTGDGKWAGASDNIEQAQLALKDIKLAEKQMKGELARLRMGQKGIKAIVDALKAEAKTDGDVETIKQLEAVKSFSCGLKVSGLGVDLNASASFTEGSEFAKCGLNPLGEKPLAFAGKDAIAATARAEDSGYNVWNKDEKWNGLLALCKKHGIDLGKFLVREKKDAVLIYTFDIGAMFKFFSEDAEEVLSKLEVEKLGDDFQKLADREKFVAKSPASFDKVCMKGFESQWTVAERFAATIPDAASKNPFYVSFSSISSVLKATAPHVTALVPEEQREGMKPVIDAFAVEAKPGIAMIGWRPKDGDTMRFMFRIAADEVRTVGGIFSYAMMFCNADGGECESDDDDRNNED